MIDVYDCTCNYANYMHMLYIYIYKMYVSIETCIQVYSVHCTHVHTYVLIFYIRAFMPVYINYAMNNDTHRNNQFVNIYQGPFLAKIRIPRAVLFGGCFRQQSHWSTKGGVNTSRFCFRIYLKASSCWISLSCFSSLHLSRHTNQVRASWDEWIGPRLSSSHGDWLFVSLGIHMEFMPRNWFK